MSTDVESPRTSAEAAVADVLQTYFDGLYLGDTALLAQAFHPSAIYATATEGHLVHLTMPEYFPIVDARPSPASRGEGRTERIVSIDVVGDATARACVQLSMGEKAFTDYLNLVRLDGQWRIIAKIFHFDIHPEGA